MATATKTKPAAEKKAEPRPVSESEIAALLDGYSQSQRDKVRELTLRATKALGYSQCREGGAVWEGARIKLLSDFVRFEVDIDEIEIPEDDEHG